MKPLYVLISSFLFTIMIMALISSEVEYQLAGRIAMALMLIFTAIGHFAFTKGMEAMVPDFLPFKKEIVVTTGVMEILFAVGLLFPTFCVMTGRVSILFFIIIFPANIKASIENINYETDKSDGPGLRYLWLRIPLQVLFIVWVYFSAIKK